MRGVKTHLPGPISGGVNLTEAETHLLDTETWGEHELLEVICSRYFILGSQGLAEHSWEVNGRDGRSPSACLRSLNRHLKNLSLIAVLDEGDPPLLSVGGLPAQMMVMPAWQQALVWALVTGFVTMAGALWVTHLDPSLAVLETAVLQTAFVFFALPVVGSVLLASYTRIFVSEALEVESSHLIPLAFPVMSAEWPFSLISAIGQLRPDLHPIPNRRALGLIELTTPTVMFVSGSILTILGLGMTPEQPPALEAAPIVVDTNFLVDILGTVMLPSDVALRLQWIHPTGLAGIALSLAGWALLLPVPGFPRGPDTARPYRSRGHGGGQQPDVNLHRHTRLHPTSLHENRLLAVATARGNSRVAQVQPRADAFALRRGRVRGTRRDSDAADCNADSGNPPTGLPRI